MSTVKRQLMDALSLSQFLIDAGWYVSAVKVLRVVENACQHLSAAVAAACNQDNTFLALIHSDTQLKLLHGYSASCSFAEADALYDRQALFLCNICVVHKAVVPFGKLHFIHALINATDDHKYSLLPPTDFDIAKVLVSFSAFIFL